MSEVRYSNPPSFDPPIGQYSQLSITTEGTQLIHVAGQLPLDARGELVADDFEGQVRHVFASVATLLEAAGSSMDRIVYLRTYMVRDEDYATFKTLRSEVFDRHGITQPPPATTVVVAGLVGGSLIEIDAVAAAAAAA